MTEKAYEVCSGFTKGRIQKNVKFSLNHWFSLELGELFIEYWSGYRKDLNDQNEKKTPPPKYHLKLVIVYVSISIREKLKIFYPLILLLKAVLLKKTNIIFIMMSI